MSRSTYREVPRRRSVGELLKFSVVGVGSAALDKGSLWLLLQRILPGTSWGISATLSFSLGVINGFLWNRHWTFRAGEHGSLGMQFFRFLSTSVVGLLLNLGATRTVFSVVISRSPMRAAVPRQVVLASLGAIPLVALWNFSASKYWAFRRPPGPVRVAPSGCRPERAEVCAPHRPTLDGAAGVMPHAALSLAGGRGCSAGRRPARRAGPGSCA